MTNFEIIAIIKELGINNFRGVFMRDQLPLCPIIPECGIVNLDDEGDNPVGNAGTHWVAYFIDSQNTIYFDSFGLEPPVELEQYLKQNGNAPILMQTQQLQDTNDTICGHLCLYVLYYLNLGYKFRNIIKLINK